MNYMAQYWEGDTLVSELPLDGIDAPSARKVYEWGMLHAPAYEASLWPIEKWYSALRTGPVKVATLLRDRFKGFQVVLVPSSVSHALPDSRKASAISMAMTARRIIEEGKHLDLALSQIDGLVRYISDHWGE